jgi:hypothetical protein
MEDMVDSRKLGRVTGQKKDDRGRGSKARKRRAPEELQLRKNGDKRTQEEFGFEVLE